MPTFTEVKIQKLNVFRAGLLDMKKADLTPKLISTYWETNRDKLSPSGYRQPWSLHPADW
jgi:hypothetical protein